MPATISDPYDLKPPDVYRQAKSVASKTNRGSDAHWYRDPCDIDYQWHLWFDGGREVCSATLSRSEKRWRPGPPLPLAGLTTADGVGDLLGELLSPVYFGKRPKALGVILHVSDEFALSEVALPAEGTSPGAEGLNFLRYNLLDSPREVLADSEVSEEQTSWRLLPFWGAPAGQPTSVAMALPRLREEFLSKLVENGEQWNVPIRVAVTCGPVEALAALGALHPNLPGDEGCLVAIPYLNFTALFAFSEKGELRAARSLAHRSGSLAPADLGQIVWNMAMSAELVGGDASNQTPPRVLLASGNHKALKEAVGQLKGAGVARRKIDYEPMLFRGHPGLQGLPGNRPEFLIYDPGAVEQFRAGAGPLAQTETFKSLWSGWGSQNFFDIGKIDALYPSQADLRVLSASKWLAFLLGALVIGLGCWGTYSLFVAMNHPSWDLTEAQVKMTEAKKTELLAERKQINTTGRLLMPRSQGWSTLEFVQQVFPEDAGARLESFAYSVDPVVAPVAKRGSAADTVGMTRQWSFKGLAKPKTMRLLNELNSQSGLSAFFDRLAKATGDTSYEPGPTRRLTLTVTEARNPKFIAESDEADEARDPSIAYPFSFEATISQSLTEKDALALPTAKPL